MATSLTDISSFSIQNQTCSCSTCTCSNDSLIYQNKIKSDYLKNNDDCLTYAFITLYESSIWCIHIIYELFFKSLWQILIYIKQELYYNKIITSVDMISINNSICKNKNYSKLSTYHLSLLEQRYGQKYSRLSKNNGKVFFNKTNQTSCQQKDSSHIVLVSVRSSYCQTEISKNDLQTINIDLKQSEKSINLNQQLTDTISRHLHEPLIFMNRKLCSRQKTIIPSSAYKQSSFNEDTKTLYSANRNNKLSAINTDLSPALPSSNILNKLSSSFLPNLTKKSSFSNNSQQFLFDLQQKKLSQKKSKQKQRIINDNYIPLTLATSLHSNLSLYNEDYFLTKYIHQLFPNKHNL